ncbi:MAG: PmoA family protein, partial [Opitutales bacterium]
MQEDNDLTVHIDGELFTEFRNDRHVPCLYPLMSPDGTHLTRQFPFTEGVAGEQADHPHHIGFWFAHGSVNGHDFWHGRKGERIVTTRLQHHGPEKHAGREQVRFQADLEWRADDKTILTETRIYSIMAKGADRVIDVSCELHASETNLVFGDTKEGSFALRLTPTMRLKGKIAQGGITSSEGIEGAGAWGKRAKWAAFHGPDSAGTPTVAAILDHPDNLRHPTWWHARGYGLLTANPFGPKSYGDQDFEG